MPATLQWTQEEDDRLRELVEEHGTKAWAKIAALIRTKGSKQCRRRWKNFLNMSAKTCSWSVEEDATLIDAHRRLGNRWTEISKIFGDRTDNAVKNRWHALTRKNPALDRESGDGSDGAPPRSKRRRTTRGAARAHTGTDADSDLLDSARYGGGHSGLQYNGSGGVSAGNTSGGVSAATMPTPFDQQTAAAAAAAVRTRLHLQQRQASTAAAADYANAAAAQQQQQQQQQQQFAAAAALAAAAAAQHQAQQRQQMQQQALQHQHHLQQQAQQQQAQQQQAQQQQAQQQQQQQQFAAVAAAAHHPQFAGGVQYAGQYFMHPQQHPGQPAPLQIMVTKDFLTPWEQQLADEINAMNLPVHVEVAPVPLPPDASLLPGLPDSLLPVGPDLLAGRSSWKQYVEKLDEPGDSKGLQELLDWFGNTNSSIPLPGATTQQGSKDLPTLGLGSRRLTRSLSKSSSGSGSGSLAGDHRQLLVKLMSRGLEARSSSEEAMAAAAAAAAAANNTGANPAAVALAPQPPTAPRYDPLKRTRSSQGCSRRSSDLERAAAAAVQQSGLAAAAAAGYTFGSGGFRPPVAPSDAPAPGSGGTGGSGARAAAAPPPRGTSMLPSFSVPFIEPTPLGLGLDQGYSDVLVTPSFSSHEIAMLLDALKPKAP